MLDVYLDESGTHPKSSICVVGGLVASPAQWQRLGRSWQKILDDFGVSDFHASDCANGGGKFKGWDKKDRDKLYIRLVNLTVRMVAFRVWTAVVMEDYRLVFNDSKEKFPYSLCAVSCASRLRWIAEKRGRDFVIPYVFDKGGKGGRAVASFDRMVKKGRGGFYQMGPITKGDRVRMPPLQAADLHAYEVYRYFSDQMEHGPSASPRKSFLQLLKISEGEGNGGYLLTKGKLESMSYQMVRQKKLEGKRTQAIDIPVDRLDREHLIKLRPNSL